MHGPSLKALHGAITAAGAVVHFVGPRVGKFVADDGGEIEANKSMENSPSVLFDALVLPSGGKAIDALARDGHTMEYVKDAYRYCKTILALGASRELLEKAGITSACKKTRGYFGQIHKKRPVQPLPLSRPSPSIVTQHGTATRHASECWSR